jgi:ECF sigma factor
MSDATPILDRVKQGDSKAAEELLPLVYAELRKLASANMAHQPQGQTLQATALVHEAWLKLSIVATRTSRFFGEAGSGELGGGRSKLEVWGGGAAVAFADFRLEISDFRMGVGGVDGGYGRDGNYGMGWGGRAVVGQKSQTIISDQSSVVSAGSWEIAVRR